MRKTTTTVLAVFFLYQFLSAQKPSLDQHDDSIFTHVEQMPYFMGCETYGIDTLAKRQCSDQELVRYLSTYLNYPSEARERGVEGTVYVSFVVDKTGAVQKPHLMIDIGSGCGQAALDVVANMPPWEPARHGGEAVNIRMNLPIQFYLRAEEREKLERYSLSWGNLNGGTVTPEELRNNLEQKVYVRGPEGDNRYVDEIEFTYEKDDRFVTASSRGEISGELKKVVEKVKRGGIFTIYASVQDRGEFVVISRTFQVVR